MIGDTGAKVGWFIELGQISIRSDIGIQLHRTGSNAAGRQAGHLSSGEVAFTKDIAIGRYLVGRAIVNIAIAHIQLRLVFRLDLLLWFGSRVNINLNHTFRRARQRAVTPYWRKPGWRIHRDIRNSFFVFIPIADQVIPNNRCSFRY